MGPSLVGGLAPYCPSSSLVGVGTGLGWTFCGDEVAREFGCGGLAGLAYMWLLQTGVDRVGLRSSTPKVWQCLCSSRPAEQS